MSDHNHEILVVNLHPSGVEEWLCPTCGRRFIVQWTPEYQCIVLNPGEESAIHNMSRGALVTATPHETSPARLAPWMDWLRTINLDRQLGEEKSIE